MDSKSLPPKHEGFWTSFFPRTQFVEKQPSFPDSIDLSSKVALITGSNVGLGFECCRQLLNLGLSRLILGVRTLSKGEAAASKLRQEAPSAEIEVWQVDMSSYASVQAFAERAAQQLDRLDIALLNAGLVAPSFKIVEENGHEETLTVNYLSTVLLGLLLLPTLRAKRSPDRQPGVLSMVNSGLSLAGKIPLHPSRPDQPILSSFDDPKSFSNTTWYSTSKTLMHMFLWKLSEYVAVDDVIVNIVDPGYVKGTDNVNNQALLSAFVAKSFAALTGRTVEVGASTYVDAVAVKGKASHGCFLTSWKVHPFNPSLYTAEGQTYVTRLWEETMAELNHWPLKEILARP